MSGDQWTARLSEYIDGELLPVEHDEAERHLGTCGECREATAQLRRVRIRAGALEDRPPQRDLWPGIAERIGVHTGAHPAVRRPHRRQWTFTLPQLAAAAVVLMAVSAGSVWIGVREGAQPDVVQAPGLLTQEFEGRFTSVVSYDAAIADLERVLSENRGQLDSNTVRVLRESLVLIDRAIVRAREALAADPGDVYLNTHLAETMRRKLALLRRAADIAATRL